MADSDTPHAPIGLAGSRERQPSLRLEIIERRTRRFEIHLRRVPFTRRLQLIEDLIGNVPPAEYEARFYEQAAVA